MNGAELGSEWRGIMRKWEWYYLEAGLLMLPTGIVQVLLAYIFIFGQFVTSPVSIQMMFGYVLLTYLVPAFLLYMPVWWIFIPRRYREIITCDIRPAYLAFPLWAFHMGLTMIFRFAITITGRALTGRKSVNFM